MPSRNCLLAILIFLSSRAHAQSRLDDLAGRFVKYIRNDHTEKIILLTDKTFYSAGETIWFKAWCLDSLSNRFTHSSKNLFVDLVDDKDSVVNQLLFNLSQLRTNGSILLPGSLREGYYWLRGYTSAILRADSNRILVKPVYIINAYKPDPKTLMAHTPKPVVEQEDTSAPQLLFFPEGGSIIAGTTATIAFRCSNTKGTPLDVDGYVTDTRNDTVARFTTLQPGMGKFSFDAFNPRKYFAHIKGRNNKDLVYPLPLINQWAYQISLVDQADRTLRLRVSLGDSLYKKNKASFILGLSRDSLCFAARGTDMYEVTVPKDNLPPGRTTFFLFDEQYHIVSQRAIYPDKKDSGLISVTTDRSVYGLGEKVNLNISVASGSDNRPVKAIFAVAVTDAPAAASPSSAQSSPEAIHLLMLLQQPLYPSFPPQTSLASPSPTSPSSATPAGSTSASPSTAYPAGSTPTSPADTNILRLKGKAVNKKNEPLTGFLVNIFAGDKGIFQLDTTDAKGNFSFNLPDYDDGTPFNLKLTTLKGQGQEGSVILDKFDFPQFNTPRQLKKGFNASEITAIRRYKDHRLMDTVSAEKGLLKPVTVEATRAAPYDQTRRVSPFSHIITSDVFTNGGINGLVNAILNVPGFNGGINSMRAATATTAGTFGLQPMVVMDGVPLNISGNVSNFLETLDPTSIEFVELLQGPLTAIYGVEGNGGVILINTVSQVKIVTRINDKGFTTIYPKGYYEQPPFAAAGHPPSTLYWDPSLLTDNTGKASLHFPAANEQADYYATVIGITEYGDILYKRIQIKCR